jgi:PhzF family phenazine biosynthesis protein
VSRLRLPIFVVDAFAARQFAGNPAAVVLLERDLSDDMLQAIASENAQPATAFLSSNGLLRWFTATMELPLCGHATLAAAHVVMNEIEPDRDEVAFRTRQSGVLHAERTAEGIRIAFPAAQAAPADERALSAALAGQRAVAFVSDQNYMAVLADAASVVNFAPELSAISKLDRSGFIVTAPGEDGFDCVSRYFAPRKGVSEDAVTGSAHCMLAPFWSERLGRRRLKARQASARGGVLLCEVAGERVLLEGQCKPYLNGRIAIDI